MSRQPKEDPMTEFKNIDYRKINGVVPGIHTPPPPSPFPAEPEKMHVTVDGQPFHVSEDTAAICTAIKMLCDVVKPIKSKK